MESTPKHVHALVRLLKSPSDPPLPQGPLKIDIANHAWSDVTFCAANKGEVLVEWLLGSLGRDGKRDDKEGESKRQWPIADPKYWFLLQQTLASSVSSARPLKVWLLPLLFRINLAGIATELLTLSHNQASCNDLAIIYAPARAALAILWPLAEKRVGMDALLESLSTVLGACATWTTQAENANDVTMQTYREDLAWICNTIISSYRNALGNFGNKKKLFTTFLSTHLPLWIRILSPPSSQSIQESNIPSLVYDALYAAGIDTLFSLEALKQPFDTLLEAFSRASTNHGLTILPSLFSSRLAAVKRYRATLFPTGSGSESSALAMHEAVRADAMAAWESCWRVLLHGILICDEHWVEQGCGQAMERRVDAWSTLVGILGVIEKERLFVSNIGLGSTNVQSAAEIGGAQQALMDVKQRALMVVERACRVDRSNAGGDEYVSLAVGALDMLVRIEYDLVGDIFGRMLAALVWFHPLSVRAKDAVEFLLSDLLEHHTKMRTVQTYTITLLAAISPTTTSSQTPTSLPDSVPSVLLTHLLSLSRAFRVALTPAQSTTLGPAVLEELRRAWHTFAIKADLDKHGDKKRKITDDGCFENTGCQAIAFVYAARTAGSILSNLPLQAYTADLGNQASKFGWQVVWSCLRRMRADHRQVPPSVPIDENEGKKKKRQKRKREEELERGQEDAYSHIQVDSIVTSAALRFLYDVRARLLRTAVSATPITLGDSDLLEEDQIEELLDIVKDEDTSPELVLEIIRTLFSQISQTCEGQDRLANNVIQTSVDVLVHHFTTTSRWCGFSSTLSRESLGIALLYVFVDRWMDLLDALAPTEVLKKFISLLLSIHLEPSSGSTDQLDGQQNSQCDVTPQKVLLRVLRSAQFWELHNMRDALLSLVLNITAPLSSYTLPPGPKSSPSPWVSVPSILELDRASGVYTLLMHVPPEYFTRSSRIELMKRAVSGDLGICVVLRDTNHRETVTDGKKRKKQRGKDRDKFDAHQISSAERDDGMDVGPNSGIPADRWVRHLTIFRAFLQRMSHAVGPLDHTMSHAYIEHLFNPPSSLSIMSDAPTRVTVDLILLHLTALLRAQGSEATALTASIITMIAEANPFSTTFLQESQKHVLVESVVFRLIEDLRGGIPPGSLSETVVSSLKSLYDSLVSTFPSTDAIPDAGYTSSRSVHARSYMLSLAQWLGIDVQANITPIGMKLADIEMCSSMIALLFQELRCMPVISYTTQLEAIAALCSIYGDEADVRHAVDAQVGTATRRLSIEEFSHLLDVVVEGIESPGVQIGQSQRLIHLSTILLHDAPQGTLKVVQNFVTRCLNAFTGQPRLYGGSSEVKANYLELIARHCSDRPAALRSVDLGSTWSLLCKILSASCSHDSTTSFTIFHHIISIASSLVRLRRDLVIHTLPHLSIVLHRLVVITRCIRPQLGGKQSKLVSDTFPSWITSTQPLGVAESRALSRLLTALTIKTVPRTHAHTMTASETQKAESLAKPFAKHAGYVLTTYIDALNDPLCLMSSDMRRELQSGLFSLCEMLGEHNRDALVISTLDSGGKAIMKMIWKEYEKQRYVGKG